MIVNGIVTATYIQRLGLAIIALVSLAGSKFASKKFIPNKDFVKLLVELKNNQKHTYRYKGSRKVYKGTYCDDPYSSIIIHTLTRQAQYTGTYTVGTSLVLKIHYIRELPDVSRGTFRVQESTE
jgi:hypothetical protein